MKTVRDACTLQDNALSITLSDQVEQLDGLITAELSRALGKCTRGAEQNCTTERRSMSMEVSWSAEAWF